MTYNSTKLLAAVMVLAGLLMVGRNLSVVSMLQIEAENTSPSQAGNTSPSQCVLPEASEVDFASQVGELVSSCAPSLEPGNFTCPAYLAAAERGRPLRFTVADELPWFKRKSTGGNSSEFFKSELDGKPAILRVGPEEDFDFAVFFAYGYVEESDIKKLLSGLRAIGKRAMVITTADMVTAPTICDGGHIFFATYLQLSKNGTVWGSVSKPKQPLDVSDRGGEPCFMFQIPYTYNPLPDAAVFARRLERPRTKLATFSGTIMSYPKRSWIEDLKGFPDISLHLVNWWAPDVTWEQRVAMSETFYRDLNESTFGLCPRGNGYSSMRFIQTVAESTLPVLMDDWILPYGESMCSFAIRARLEGDHLTFVRELRKLAARPDWIAKRLNNMRRFVECYWPNRDNGLSAPFVVHVARRALAGDLLKWMCSILGVNNSRT